MDVDILSWNVILAAVGIAVLHTAVGPDHYLPFVMIGRARRWSLRRTLLVTAACGAGHVLSSLLLGFVGIFLGVMSSRLAAVEAQRGELAAWALVAFGIAYALWGVRHALRRRKGLELHQHGGHVHLHSHGNDAHGHSGQPGPDASFWTLFAIFVLGPCEPLIPLFILPASTGRWSLAVVAAATFGVVTVATMLVLTAVARAGIERLPLGPLETWSHSLAGVIIAGSGLAVIFLGI